MKITRVRCRVVDLPLDAPFHPAWARGRNQTNVLLVLVEIETDAGITGITAAHAGPEAAVCVERFVTPYFLGRDPTAVEALTVVLRDCRDPRAARSTSSRSRCGTSSARLRAFPSTSYGADIADRVTAYCATAEVRPPELRVRDAERMPTRAIRAMKLRFHSPDPRDDLKVVEAIRRRVGDRIAMMVDANQAGIEPGFGGHRAGAFSARSRWRGSSSRSASLWLEEPLPRHDYDGLARLRDKLGTLQDRRRRGQSRPARVQAPDRSRLLRHPAARRSAVGGHLPASQGRRHGGGCGNSSSLRTLGATASASSPISTSPPQCRTANGWSFPHDPPSGFTLACRDQNAGRAPHHRRRRRRPRARRARIRLSPRRGAHRAPYRRELRLRQSVLTATCQGGIVGGRFGTLQTPEGSDVQRAGDRLRRPPRAARRRGTARPTCPKAGANTSRTADRPASCR